ncbi:hypothetical protein [Flagellimonas sp.]|uniref:hypothetical protein n=1 Tax=Flagellimonas sp. TaxID=2058762 RepID=UPI003B51F29E
MKKMFGVVLIIGVYFYNGCSHKDELATTVIELNGRINEELRYQLGSQPTEGSYSITQQPESYKTSEIVVDDVSGKLNYLFIPADNFSGRETVEIILKTSIGDDNFKSLMIVLKISIQ